MLVHLTYNKNGEYREIVWIAETWDADNIPEEIQERLAQGWEITNTVELADDPIGMPTDRELGVL